MDNDQIQKATKPNTIPVQPFGPVTAYTRDNICSTSIAPDRSPWRCIDCEFFDGYDMCCHHENFGSITRQSLDNCVKHNLQREKLYGTSKREKPHGTSN